MRDDLRPSVRRRILRWTALAAVVLLASAGAAVPAAQGQKPAGPTVWDGVYTDAQADRASAIFQQSCSNCHTLTADGGRPLSGEKFWESYTQRTVGDLLKYVRTSMPNNNPGSLPAATYNDLVALILKSNGFPSGKTEFGDNAGTAAQIIPKDGPGELPANTLVRVVGCLAKSGPDWVLTNATVPERIDKTGAVPEDATRPLGDRSLTLRFVLTRLDKFVGQRMSASGILMGVGGVNGLNVTTVSPVGESCP